MSATVLDARHPGDVALVELVNRVLDRGVVLTGEVTISVAEVDLLYLGLRLLLCSPDQAGVFDAPEGKAAVGDPP